MSKISVALLVVVAACMVDCTTFFSGSSYRGNPYGGSGYSHHHTSSTNHPRPTGYGNSAYRRSVYGNIYKDGGSSYGGSSYRGNSHNHYNSYGPSHDPRNTGYGNSGYHGSSSYGKSHHGGSAYGGNVHGGHSLPYNSYGPSHDPRNTGYGNGGHPHHSNHWLGTSYKAAVKTNTWSWLDQTYRHCYNYCIHSTHACANYAYDCALTGHPCYCDYRQNCCGYF